VRVDEFSHEADEESFAMRTALLLCFLWAAAAFEPRPAAPCSTPSLRRRAYSPVQPRSAALAASAVARRAVVTDMDETLIKSKSTGHIVAFLVQYRAYLRLAVALPLAAVLIPLSKVNRALAVRCMYFLAFRG
jgi:hypothetical protein